MSPDIEKLRELLEMRDVVASWPPTKSTVRTMASTRS